MYVNSHCYQFLKHLNDIFNYKLNIAQIWGELQSIDNLTLEHNDSSVKLEKYRIARLKVTDDDRNKIQ